MYIVPPSRRGCSIPSSTVSRITTPSRDQGTYMITLNPAARSCLPRPIVNLWWKWWLSLKFASHFIFWCYRLKKFSWFYSAVVNKSREWNHSLAFTSISQQLYPACTAPCHGVNMVNTSNEIYLLESVVFSLRFGVFQFWRCLYNERGCTTPFRYV